MKKSRIDRNSIRYGTARVAVLVAVLAIALVICTAWVFSR